MFSKSLFAAAAVAAAVAGFSATQANAGDIVNNRQYWATYVDSLDSGNGGFVLR